MSGSVISPLCHARPCCIVACVRQATSEQGRCVCWD
jgi:hypothetical protein